MLSKNDPRPGSSSSRLPKGYRKDFRGDIRRPDNSIVKTVGGTLKSVRGVCKVGKK